jgi:hypothetical protein
MMLEYRVAKLESDMSNLMSGDVKIPTRSRFNDSICRFVSSAPPIGLKILCVEILCVAFELGLIVGAYLEHENPSHNTPASVSGPVNPPGHDTPEDPR